MRRQEQVFPPLSEIGVVQRTQAQGPGDLTTWHWLGMHWAASNSHPKLSWLEQTGAYFSGVRSLEESSFRTRACRCSFFPVLGFPHHTPTVAVDKDTSLGLLKSGPILALLLISCATSEKSLQVSQAVSLLSYSRKGRTRLSLRWPSFLTWKQALSVHIHN